MADISAERRQLNRQKLKLISLRDDLNKSIERLIDIETALIQKTKEQDDE